MPYADPAHRRLPFQSISETSRDAAVTAGTFAGTQADRYVGWLRGRGLRGGTDAEAEADLNMRRSSVCARRNECMATGAVVKTDARRDGCAVWRAV